MIAEELPNINEGIETNSYKKRKKKHRHSSSEVDPTCPFCFKLLLNPEKMRIHLKNCQMSKKEENPFRFKIQLIPETNNMAIKENE